MRSFWLVLVACAGCSSSSTNDNANPGNGGSSSGGSAGASSGGSANGGASGNGGTGTGGTGGTSSGGGAGAPSGGSGGLAGASTGGAGGAGGAAGGMTGGAAGSMTGGTGGNGCASTGIKINEVLTRGANVSDEFVELYNPGQSVITLTGYELKVSDSGGSTPTTIWTGTSNDKIVSQGFFVIGGDTFAGPKGASFNQTNALPQAGGIGLMSAPVWDMVAWGTLSTPSHPYQEGNPAINGAAGTSMERMPNGYDCDDNAADFDLAPTPTPNASNNP